MYQYKTGADLYAGNRFAPVEFHFNFISFLEVGQKLVRCSGEQI